ncbi:MAG: nitrous oxide reductase accessory protein NosL [Pseudomonadota bacterium]
MKLIKNIFPIIAVLMAILLLSACGDKQTGPTDVKWDRDACDRCQMMLSDRKFSAQIRVFPEGKRSKVFRFDDIGCATLWLDSQQKKGKLWQSDEKTQIWVTDFKSGAWIEAKTAWYVKDQISPMNYGLGAVLSKQTNALDFEQAKKHIQEVEKKLNIHGGNFTH